MTGVSDIEDTQVQFHPLSPRPKSKSKKQEREQKQKQKQNGRKSDGGGKKNLSFNGKPAVTLRRNHLEENHMMANSGSPPPG